VAETALRASDALPLHAFLHRRRKCRCGAETLQSKNWLGEVVYLDPEPTASGNVVLTLGGKVAPPGLYARPPEIRAIALGAEMLSRLDPETPRLAVHACRWAGQL
jgi:hypothetical protein